MCQDHHKNNDGIYCYEWLGLQSNICICTKKIISKDWIKRNTGENDNLLEGNDGMALL